MKASSYISFGSVASVVLGGLAFSCGSSESRAPEPLGKFKASLISVDGQTTVESGTPSTRNATCPDGSLPDQCGSWDGTELLASLGNGDERCLCRPIDFQVPATMPVTSGNAGKHKATLSFRKESGAMVECKYKGERSGGRSGQSSGGWQYAFEKCSDNSVAGTKLRADWFSLTVSATDTQAGPGETKLRLGEPDVVGGVVQEMIFYSSDPRIGEAALHVPRGAAPSYQDFNLSVLDQVPVGGSFENGGAPGNGVGYAVDVHAVGVDDFVFTPVPGASCPRVELPYDPNVLLALGISEERLQARQILDLDALLAGQSALAPVGGVNVDPLRHTLSFCVEHLSFYLGYSSSWDADLISALWSGTNTDLVTDSAMPPVQPSQSYTLTLTFDNWGSKTWTHHAAPVPLATDDVFLVAVQRTDNHTGTPTVLAIASPWFGGQDYTNDVFAPTANVIQDDQATFTVDLVAPETTTTYAGGLYLNLCLAHRRDLVTNDLDFFGTCFSWDPSATEDFDTGYIAASIVEICDGKDNDGDNETDEGLLISFYEDFDADGFGNVNVKTDACNAPPGYVTNASDCDDTNAAINPNATEICNDVDDNCDHTGDDALKSTFYKDGDLDGFGNSSTILACSMPNGYAAVGTDCNDGNSAINPGATEICNYVDDNCGGGTDEGLLVAYRSDSDGDTWCAPSSTVACPQDQPGGTIPDSDCSFYVDEFGETESIYSDCNDSNPYADHHCRYMYTTTLRSIDYFAVYAYPVDCGTGWHIASCEVSQPINNPGIVYLAGECAVGQQTADLEVVYYPYGDEFISGWPEVRCEADASYP